LLLLLPFPLRESFRRWREWDRGTLFVACWAVFPVLFFSISRSKLPGYILPSLPAIAVLLGKNIASWIEGRIKPPRFTGAAWISLVFSLALATAFPFVIVKNYQGNWWMALPVSAAILIPSVVAYFFARKGLIGAVCKTNLVQGVIIVLALSQFTFPALGAYHSSREIARQIAAVREPGEPLVTFRYFQHSLHYYSGYTVTDDLSDIFAMAAFAREHSHFLFVSEAGHVWEVERIPGFHTTLLGSQGKLRLLRMYRR
jgi:4-amino-4-deoxy-L-arabinose transferase-like glycosyltransferase